MYALQDTIHQFTGVSIYVENVKYTSESVTHQHMFAGFDNMEARKTMYERWKSLIDPDKASEFIFIDGRLLAEQLQIFTIKGDDLEKQKLYETEHLFSDADVADGPCSFRQTTHVAALIASLMVGTYTNHISNCVEGSNIRSTPFLLEYFVPLHLLEYHA